MTIPIGRKGQVYLKKEAAYGVEETLVAANALRHIEVGFGFDPFNRVTSPEKKQSPGPANRFDRKKSAELSTIVGLLRPSGTLNTLPEIDPVLEAGFGSLTNVTLDTTVASAPTTTGATVASAGALAVGDAVLLTVTGEAGPFVRILTAVSGAALTWAPALPAAQTVGDAVKGGITYELATDLAIALTIAHYVPNGRNRELLGVGINQLTVGLDPNEEPRISASGPAKEQLSKANVQAQPGAFTTVGGNPPPGHIGELFIDGTLYKHTTGEISIANGLAVRNQELGVNAATELYRQGRREISLSLESFLGDEALYDLAEAGTNATFLHQTGKTEGNIVAVYAPKVEWKVPEQDDAEEELKWSFSGMALESVDGANDEISLALM